MLDKIKTDHPGDKVSEAVLREVEAFLYREARLLDAELYRDWLALMDPEIHYWMPGIETRRRDDRRVRYAHDEMAYFDDDLALLTIRVARFVEPTAWADNPATRHVHVISNVEAFASAQADEVVAFSVFTNVRNRNLKDQDILYGRREDVLRRDAVGNLRLLKRKIVVAQDILLSKNINTFL